MTINDIQKIWVLIGSLLTAFGAPDWLLSLFGEAGTDVVFRAVFAVAALWQFLPFRTNKPNAPQAMKEKASNMYWIPFTRP